MTIDQMRFKVVTGGGNMPAYGKNLSPPEIEALVSFLETLHPANEPPAYDASRRAVDAAEPPNESVRTPASGTPAMITKATAMSDTTTIADLFTRWDIPWIVTTELALTALDLYARLAADPPHAPCAISSWRLATFLGGIVAPSSLLPRRSIPSASPCFSCTWRSILCSCPRAAAHRLRRARSSHAARIAAIGDSRLLRPLFVSRFLLPAAGVSHESARCLAGHDRCVYPLAHSARLRIRAFVGELAQFRARLFFFTNLMFWWPIVHPWPAVRCARAGC